MVSPFQHSKFLSAELTTVNSSFVYTHIKIFYVYLSLYTFPFFSLTQVQLYHTYCFTLTEKHILEIFPYLQIQIILIIFFFIA